MNKNVRVARGHHGEIVIVAAWCPSCRREVLPSLHGRCNWCERRIINEDTLSAREMLEQLSGDAA